MTLQEGSDTQEPAPLGVGGVGIHFGLAGESSLMQIEEDMRLEWGYRTIKTFKLQSLDHLMT